MQIDTQVSDAQAATITEDLPELELIGEPATREKLIKLWASFLGESTYERISSAPAFPGVPGFGLAKHISHVVCNCVDLADNLLHIWNIDCDREALLAAALAHDS